MAFLSPTSTSSVFPGYVVVNVGFDTWLPWAQGQTFVGAVIGIALTPALPGNPFQVQSYGLIPYNVFKLPSSNTTSSIAAGQTPSRGTSGQLIGTADISGNISLPGTVVGGIPGGGGGGGLPSIANTGLAHVTGSVIDAAAHLGAVATSPLSSGTDYIDTGMMPVLNVKTFGAKGDGVTDDTLAVQAAINAATTSNTNAICPITLFFPMGVYIVSSQLTVDSGGPGSGLVNYIRMRGEMGGHGGFTASTIRWNGASYATMFAISNVFGIRVSELNFDANGIAAICVQLRAFTTGVKFTNCAFINTISIPVWQPNTPYPQNTLVIPSTVIRSTFQDNGHYYKATVAGTSNGTQPTFPVTAAGTVTDGGVTWTEQGASPVCFAAGDLTGPYAGSQVSEVAFRDCWFAGRGFSTASYGTTPPGVTVTGSPPSIATNIQIVITTGGALGTAQFTWKMNGVVQQTAQVTAATFALGTTGLTANFPAGTYSTTNFYVSSITTAGAWKCLSGFNVKDFTFNDCLFTVNGVAIDCGPAAGTFTVHGCVFSNNQCDLRCASATMIVNSLESEGSGYLLFSNLGTTSPAQVSLYNSFWSGTTPLTGDFTNYGTGTAFILYGGGLEIQGSEFIDVNNSFPLIIVDGVTSNFPASFRSRGNVFVFKHTYTGELFFPVFDASTNAYYTGTKQYYLGYGSGALQTRVSSDGDYFTPDSGGTNIPIHRYDGQDLQLARQMLTAKPAGALTSPNITYPTLGSVVGACARFTVPYTAAQLAALTSTLTLTQPWNKTKIKAIYLDVTTGFSGGAIATVTAEVGKIVQVGGTSTTNAYLVATSVAAVPANPIGFSSGDLGADLAGAVQGGALVWGPTDGNPINSRLWNITITFRSTGANLSALTAGSLDVYILFEVLPGYNA